MDVCAAAALRKSYSTERAREPVTTWNLLTVSWCIFILVLLVLVGVLRITAQMESTYMYKSRASSSPNARMH